MRVTLQTVNRRSLFTQLDFRSKLWMVVVLTFTTLLWESPLLQMLLALTVIAAGLIAGITPNYIFTVLTLMLPFYIFMILTQGFWGDSIIMARTGQTELRSLFAFPEGWWLIGGARMSLEGVLYAFGLIFKTFTMTLLIPLSVFTTDFNQMIVSLVKLGMPYKLAFVFSSTLRFFPLLFAEIQAIIDAQRLRGLSLEDMGAFKRITVYAKIAIPLILGAMVKAQMLDVVLQAKAFSGDSERTYLHESVLGIWDYVSIVVLGLFLALVLGLYVARGVGKFGGPI